MSSIFTDQWVAPGLPSVQLFAVSPKHTALACQVVLGYCHGSTQFYPLPEARSQLLKHARIPASCPSGRAMRDWLDALLQPTSAPQDHVEHCPQPAP